MPPGRAIAFSNKIISSKNLEIWWPAIIDRIAADTGRTDDLGKTLLKLQVRHIDGKTRASIRAQALNDLNADIPDGQCHIITNARCLTEGVDVPALDAVLFMEPRTSKVEIVQAVGRVMRRHEGKKRGYIVLPVIVPEGKRVTDSQFLRSSEFQPVWDVISALRAHDERMDVWVNTADMGGKPPITITDHTQPADEDESTGGGGNGDIGPIKGFIQMSLPLNEEIASALVERCGDKRYWKRWGDDVAEVSTRVRDRIETLLDRPDRPDIAEAFDRFLGEMKQTITEHLQAEQLVGMLASHLVTLPVFEALFGNAEFAHRNPVVKALSEMADSLDDEGLLNEARELNHFYESVQIRVQEVADPDGRLRILLDLYETFFDKADPKEASRSGIVYTPIEIVDFILRSADTVARQEFGKGLTDENVHILDPFTGTGTFINRILTLPDLIADHDLARKYASELHANELLLLPYYIAAVKIEQGYISRRSWRRVPTVRRDRPRRHLRTERRPTHHANHEREQRTRPTTSGPSHTSNRRQPPVVSGTKKRRRRQPQRPTPTPQRPDKRNIRGAKPNYQQATVARPVQDVHPMGHGPARRTRHHSFRHPQRLHRRQRRSRNASLPSRRIYHHPHIQPQRPIQHLRRSPTAGEGQHFRW